MAATLAVNALDCSFSRTRCFSHLCLYATDLLVSKDRFFLSLLRIFGHEWLKHSDVHTHLILYRDGDLNLASVFCVINGNIVLVSIRDLFHKKLWPQTVVCIFRIYTDPTITHICYFFLLLMPNSLNSVNSVREQFLKSADGRGNFACDLLTMHTYREQMQPDNFQNDHAIYQEQRKLHTCFKTCFLGVK